jgi:polyhydroxyalkanoate synthesis repressor PhaR
MRSAQTSDTIRSFKDSPADGRWLISSPGAGYKSRIRDFKRGALCCAAATLYFPDNAIVLLKAYRLPAPHRFGQPRTSSVADRAGGVRCNAKKGLAAQKKRLSYVDARRNDPRTGFNHMANSTTPITIKKYANRRLYNTASSAYVTLADLAKMVKAGEDFIVYDAKSNDDITRSVLTQIIFEQEGIAGQSLLPTTFLRQLIRFYGDSMQAILPSYLEFSIDRFSGEQPAMREAASRMFGPEAFSAGSFAAMQELTKKNFAAFNQALAMFSPFAGAALPADSLPKKANSEGDIDDLRSQLSDMQKRLESLAKKTETP